MKKISNSDQFRVLKFFEKWGTYAKSTGKLSMEKMIAADGGKNFSSFLCDEDEIVPSCGLSDIPQVDVLLLWGETPQAARYAAEAAIRHQKQYGKYPELAICGKEFRCGFAKGKTQTEVFETVLLGVGFAEEWVNKHHTQSPQTCVEKLKKLQAEIAHQGKLKVLAVTGAGHSLLAAQKLVPKFPQVEFVFLETPSIQLGKRSFIGEQYDENGLGVDMLIANVLASRMMKPEEGLLLSAEKMLNMPGKKEIAHFLKMGYAMFCDNPKVWKWLGFKKAEGMAIHRQRKEFVASLPYDAEAERKNINKLIVGIKDRLKTLDLPIA